MVALRDPETRKRGVVCLVSFIGKNTNIESSRAIGFRGMWKVPKLSLCLPIHVAAVHMGYDSVKWTPAHVILRMAFNLFTRVRYRAHYGKISSCLPLFPEFYHTSRSLSTYLRFRYNGRVAEINQKLRYPPSPIALQE